MVASKLSRNRRFGLDRAESKTVFSLRCGKRMASQCECVPKPVRVLFVECCVQGYRRTRETGCCLRASYSKAVSHMNVSRYAPCERRLPLLNFDWIGGIEWARRCACLLELVGSVQDEVIFDLNKGGHSWKFSLRKKTNNPGLKQLGFNF